MIVLSDGFSIDMAIKSDICYRGYLIAMISCYGSDKYGVGISKLNDRCLCVDEV
jgi:hypothetical protein